jgi:hypothetical protein
MKKLILTATIMVSALSSLAQKDTISVFNGSVPYTKAENYFFRNDAQIPSNPVIIDAKTFNSYFGMATVMGENGKPTEIDFSKQFVIATVLPPTDINTRIEPTRLKISDKAISYAYAIVKGRKMHSKMQPILILIVDRKYLRNEFSCTTSVRHAMEEGDENPLIMVIDPEDYKDQIKTLDELDKVESDKKKAQ